MKKILKKTIRTIAIVVSLCSMMLIIFLANTMHISLLEPAEQEKLKLGKQFWEWHSPHGPLAMHYIEKGEGPNHILLLHGFRAHTYTWKALIDPLADAGYHVWAIDLIGYGLSDKPTNVTYNVDFFVEHIQAFMEAKGIAPAHLIGNSMGGGLALSLAIHHPQSIRSLTLLNALGYPLDMPLTLSLGRHIAKVWPGFLAPPMIRFGLRQIVYQPDSVSDEQVEAYSLPYRFPGGVNASLLTLDNFDNRHLVDMQRHYSSLNSYPTLIIWGDHDKLIPVSHYEKFVQDFPHADKRLIPNCGHIPQEETPDQVLAAILHFLPQEDKKIE